jgi:hypothetical protein
MFAARQRPLLLVEDRLLALRLSLNAPVLATAELPAGPARAALVVFSEGSLRNFAIIVRSLRNGASAVYELQGDDLREHSGWSVALDASLSFGESMGFLFDDEMLVDRGPDTLRRAIARLHEILAPADVADEDALASSAPDFAAEELSEILLEDELDHAVHGAAADGPETTGSLETAPVVAPVLLSKFRAAPTAPPKSERVEAPPAPAPPEALMQAASPNVTARGATLGRVRPVRLRAPDPAAPTKVDPLVRLLADF